MAEGSYEKLNKPKFETVFEEYYDRVYKYAYTILLNKEDAEDITENTFLLAYSHYDQYDSQLASIGTWLTRIAHNSAVNYLRSAAYVKHADLPESWDIASEDDFTDQVETSDLILALYSRLSIDEREFLNLRYAMNLKDTWLPCRSYEL